MLEKNLTQKFETLYLYTFTIQPPPLPFLLEMVGRESRDIYDKFCQGENVDFPSLFKDILQKR